MRFILILLAIIAAAPGQAGAGDGVADIFARTPHQNANTVRGEFTQYKYLAELERPLVSRGEFTAARGHGIIWRITAPIQSTVVITDTHLIETVNGRETVRVSVDERPGLKWIGSILMAVFRADTERLEEFFSLSARTDDNNHWTLEMAPRLDAVADYIEAICVQGAADIQRITIVEQSGDRSAIEIDHLTGSTQALTPQEKQLLQ